MVDEVSDATSHEDDRASARRALEEVCARGDFDAAETLYSPRFLDHVNDFDFAGHEGIRRSVGLYRRVFANLEIRVEDQVAEGDRVASRWTAEGTNRGRPVALKGITVSRFEDGGIVEDWTVSDNLSLVRQLGLWRTMLMGLGELRARLTTTARD